MPAPDVAEMQPSDCAALVEKDRRLMLAAKWAAADAAREFCLPKCYHDLGTDWHFREKLRISPEQEKRLREVAASFVKENERVHNQVGHMLERWPSNSWPRDDARRIKERWEQQAEAARKQIEEILTPAQVAACKRRFLAEMMPRFRLDEEEPKTLGLTAGQKAKFAELRAELDRRLHELKQDSGAQCFAMFKPEQQTKLREAVEKEERAAEEMPKEWTHPICGGWWFSPGYKRAYPVVLPVYMDLREATVRKELGLTPDQEKDLRAISATFVARIQEEIDHQRQYAPRPADAANEYSKQVDRKQMEMIKDIRRKVETLLTPKQLAAIKEINYRTKILWTWFVQKPCPVAILWLSPELIKEIGPTKKQQAALEAIRDHFWQTQRELEDEINHKFLDVLTPKQQGHLLDESE